MKREPRALPSIRTLSYASATLFATLTLAVIAALVISSALLRDRTASVGRDTEAAMLVGALQQDLLAYQRVGNLWVVTNEPELEQARAMLTEDMRELLPQIHVRGDTEAQLVAETRDALDDYLAEREALERAGTDLGTLTRDIRPAFNRVLERVSLLREMNEDQVARAQEDAEDMTVLSDLVALAAAAVLAAGLVAVVLGVKRYVLRPVLDLRAEIERFRDGDPEARSRGATSREMAEIGHAFDEMVEALSRQRQVQLAFLAGVAHDLRTPLSGLKLGVQTLAANPSLATPERLNLLDRHIQRLTRMVGDLLDATRIEAGELELHREDVDLRQPAREIVDLYDPTAPDHVLSLDVPDEPVAVHVDPLRIEQVISNLMSNAIKYSPAGGPVNVVVTETAEAAEVTISDRGVGIPSEDLDQLFIPFRRRPATREVAPGVGLGLSVVRRIVVAHGGDIHVESTPGRGSTFCVRLPRRAAPPDTEAGVTA